MELSLNIKEFSFTDLLAMLMAFFAIALSVAFYFKATETSNRFYDNSYIFTKDVSEILGRMEAGFGERLRHLEEGYTGISNKIDKIPFDSNKALADVEKEKEDIKKNKEEQRVLLDELANKAKLAKKEKEELFKHMEKLNRELEHSKLAARKLEKKILLNSSEKMGSYKEMLKYLHNRLNNHKNHMELRESSFLSGYNDLFLMEREKFHEGLLIDLDRSGVMDKKGNLTKEAIDRLQLMDL